MRDRRSHRRGDSTGGAYRNGNERECCQPEPASRTPPGAAPQRIHVPPTEDCLAQLGSRLSRTQPRPLSVACTADSGPPRYCVRPDPPAPTDSSSCSATLLPPDSGVNIGPSDPGLMTTPASICHTTADPGAARAVTLRWEKVTALHRLPTDPGRDKRVVGHAPELSLFGALTSAIRRSVCQAKRTAHPAASADPDDRGDRRLTSCQ